MPFIGYKLGFELYAGHSNVDSKDGMAEHFHTFSITLYLKKGMADFVPYSELENIISQFLEPFQNKKLKDMPLFYEKSTMLESIGDLLFEALKPIIIKKGYSLVKLSITETPIHEYSVSEKPLDKDANEISLFSLKLLDGFQEKSLLADKNNNENSVLLPSEKTDENILPESTKTEESSGSNSINNQSQNTSIQKDNPKQEPAINNTDNNNISPAKKILKLFLALGFVFACSVILVFVIKSSGIYPRGSDTLNHLYRSDFLYNSMLKGKCYPLYDLMWYNGMEIMRYWAPLPLYLLAICQFAAGGSILGSYLVFIGSMLFIGAVGWILFGWKENRIELAAVIGVLWFFIPENMRILFNDGNIPRTAVAAMLPYLLYFIWRFIDDRKWSSIIPVILITAGIGLCHLMIAAMVGITVFLFVCVHSIAARRYKEQLLLLTGMVLSFSLIGIWLAGALHGGLMSLGESTSQVMKDFFQNGMTSLNPILRLNGGMEVFYFGLSVFAISIFGLFLGSKKTFPGFFIAVFIFLSTTLSVFPLIEKLPFHQFLWMIRFVSIALGMCFMSIILWKQLKNSIVLIICLLIIADIIPSLGFVYARPENRVVNAEENQLKRAEEMLLLKGKSITKQRMALLDLSSYGSFASYMISGIEPKTAYSFGWGWQGANTAENIVMLNTAYSEGYYPYLFDRCLELGNDTIIARVSFLKNKDKDIESFIEAGTKLGYKLIEFNKDNLVFHKDTPDTFGVITQYDNIAIGTSSSQISFMYPNFQEADSIDLNDYSFEFLKKYKKIYLSGFICKDRSKAEDLLNKLANAGVEIYIDMNRIPVNSITNQHEILGVSAQSITFEEQFPNLFYKGIEYFPDPFKSEYRKWNTVYLSGLNKAEGSCILDQKEIAFAGIKDNPNIHFIGFNLLFHMQTSDDAQINKLLEDIFDLKSDILPRRELVPIEVTHTENDITIKSPYSNVNTTLSFHDIFESNSDIASQNNLLYVEKGTTIIHLNYPYFKQGLMLSLLGIIVISVFLIISYKCFKKHSND